ncbi:hypothetical protein [Amycolatopsis tucumanensis]|uniref:DUF4185 domain-containing protein n=1 Tax=Amycolatopsis tucumanensis TaxID=401106 RepID=A0ABP7HFZ9_9PSEU|nr:hypothetical protein [Amycolatopsis tucumanensis]MCF6423695.1 hypothetical protein [Amycolatopsis tucumanensis]
MAADSSDASPVSTLLATARSPLGPAIRLDLGWSTGPLAELADLLSQVNGFTVFNAGVQVFHAGSRGLGPELGRWNAPNTWKDTYAGLADDLFCFGQDLFGRQFAIEDRRRVVVFDAETAERTSIGTTLDEWAAWLLHDPDVNGTHRYATAWQDEHGALEHNQRLIPWQLFSLGGSYDFDNVTVKDAECMRVRGPFAHRIHELPDGAQITLMPEPTNAQAGDRLAYAELDVFADYNYFLVQDDSLRPGLSDEFTDALIDDLVATEDGVLGVGTARRVTVPVVLEVLAHEPVDELDEWDHITEGGLTAPTGRLLASSMDYSDHLPRTTVPAGDYAARIYYRGFRTISSDGLHGDDLYRVVLWPAAPRAARVVKRFDGELPGG